MYVCVCVLLLLQEWSQGKRLKRTLITTMTFTGPSSTTSAASSSSPAAAASSSNNEKGAVETDLILSLKAATLVNGPDGGTRAERKPLPHESISVRLSNTPAAATAAPAAGAATVVGGADMLLEIS